jgi:putative hydrolase of the HAD superfamily
MTSAVDFREVLRDVSDREDVIEGLYQERLAAKAKPFVNVEQGVLDVLQLLRREELRLGLVSNCSLEEVAAWERSPLAPLFDDVVFSYQVGKVKPDPAIFVLACDRLGVEPRHTVFVGDGGSDELAGATAAGMRALCAGWFLDRWPEARSRSVAGFPRLASPTELLDALL